MVARQNAARARAIAAVTLLVAVALPLTPSTSLAQSEVVLDQIRIEWGNVTLQDPSTTRVTMFYDAGDRVQVKFVSSNYGSEKTNVPAWIWLQGVTQVSGRCILLNYAPGTTNEPAHVTSEPVTFVLPPDLSAQGHNFTVRVNTDKPTGTGIPTFPSECDGNAYSRKDALVDDTATNEAFGYFVANGDVNYLVERVYWCNGAPENVGDPSQACGQFVSTCDGVESDRCDPTCHAEEDARCLRIPFTSEAALTDDTHFIVDVVNNGSYADTTNYGGKCANGERTASSCPHFPYVVNLTIKTPDGSTAWLTRSGSSRNVSAPGASDWWKSDLFDLRGKAGNYTVTAKISWGDDLYLHDNQATYTAYVRYADLVPAADDTWPSTRADALPYEDGARIRGNVTVTNFGERTLGQVAWRAHLDADTQGHFRAFGNITSLAAGASEKILYEKIFNTLAEDPTTYLTPGEHTLTFIVDYTPGADDGAGSYSELDDTNNTIRIPVYVLDQQAPVFAHAPHVHLWFGNNREEPLTSGRAIHPHERFMVRANVTDADAESLLVVANFTNDDEENETRAYTMRRVNDAGTYEIVVTDLPMAGNGTSTNWTLRVEATDAFENFNDSAARAMRMNVWPVHTVPVDYLVRNETDGAKFNWSTSGQGEVIRYEVFLRKNMTGFADQATNLTKTQNLRMRIETPDGSEILFDPEYWSPGDCDLAPGGGLAIRGEETIPPEECDDYGMWRTTVPLAGGAPGIWNVSIWVEDISGTRRTVNRTFEVVDRAPIVYEIDPRPTSLVVNASENLSLDMIVFDDFDSTAVDVYVNFTRTDGYSANFSAKGGVNVGNGNASYTLNVTTGRGKMLGMAGQYNMTVVARDQNGNWGGTVPIPFAVRDGERPTFLNPVGVTPSPQEINSNVTFYATVHDNTNVTVELRVRPRGSSEVLDPPGVVQLVEGLDGNFTFTTQFAEPGDYDWSISAIDSVGLRTDPEANGALSIRRNLGPRYEIRAPSTVIAGERYGVADPRIEVLVYDSDGVDPESISMQIGTNLRPLATVTPKIEEQVEGLQGYLLTYEIPSKDAFDHGTTVRINISATDLSSEALSQNMSFQFVVDAEEPTVRISDYSPKYADAGALEFNVSPDTRFVIDANDEDGVATGVSVVTYSIGSVSQSSAVMVYNGPFRLSDVKGLLPRDGRYTIYVTAEDAVGNRNKHTYTMSFYLDASPPEPNPYTGVQPKDRDIRLSLLDPGAGIDRAVTWYRVNNGSWDFLTMEVDGDVWYATLPDGRKNDAIDYYIQVWDRVDNTQSFGSAEKPYSTYVVPNHAPTLRIKTPLNGDDLSRRVTVEWESEDVDNDALVFVLLLKKPGATAFSEIARIEQLGRRTFEFDTTKFGDGDYTLRIDVDDGMANNRSDVSFSIHNKASAIGAVGTGKATLLPGEPTLVTAEITKADVISVEAHLFRDGEFVASYAMRDDGEGGDTNKSDGFWSTFVSVDKAGDYRVSILTKYREGGVERNATQENAVAFSVAMTPGYILSNYAPLVALTVLAAAVAMGVAGYIVFRRRS